LSNVPIEEAMHRGFTSDHARHAKIVSGSDTPGGIDHLRSLHKKPLRKIFQSATQCFIEFDCFQYRD
jgi:hypothetical protein